jgi:predicted MFS family arabinose efflux permease
MENFTTVIRSIASDQNEFRRERLLKVLSAATFLIFFQAYMVAPLIPRLSIAFGISAQQIGLIVPAYLIPYGVSTLFMGCSQTGLVAGPLYSPPSRLSSS